MYKYHIISFILFLLLGYSLVHMKTTNDKLEKKLEKVCGEKEFIENHPQKFIIEESCSKPNIEHSD